MEYYELPVTWQYCLENDNFDAALKQIELQIALNLKDIHNKFCEAKIASHLDSYSKICYGQKVYKEDEEKMQKFIEIDKQFIEIGHSLDLDSTCSKEYILEAFKTLENTLKEEMLKI